MRYSVKRTFAFPCVRKYTHIRLQKRFKFKKHKFFPEGTQFAAVLQLQANTGFAYSRFTS
jgi:hypothetical protein